MIACPTSETLANFLTGETPDAQLCEHVGECGRCQGELDRLTEDEVLHEWLREGKALTNDTAPAVLKRLLNDARGSMPLDADATTLALLGAPRRANDLGTLGPYDVEAEIGRGGMGIVFRGFDPQLRRTVALKVLHPAHADATARLRLVREAQIAAHFRHDHFVTVHAVHTPPEGLAYLVMEYIDGPTLACLLRQRGGLAVRDAATFVAQVAGGLAAAHAAGFVHRDIKPSNIIIETATNRAKIMDFGIAHAVDATGSLTQTGTLAGTPTYMSPEQTRGDKPLGPATDVYSLGVTLYEALTGDVPFRGAPHMVMQQVLHDEPRPPRRLNDAVPRDLETICLKALAKEPARRYATAAAFADDLGRWLRGEPIRARPVGSLGRLHMWCRRQPVRAALLGTLILALAGALWQWWRAENNAARAEHERIQAQTNGQEAWDNFQDARQAVDTFYARFYTERLLGKPGLEAVRKQALQDLLSYYRGFLKRRRDDPALRDQLAETCFRVALLTSDLGDKADALPVFQEAAGLYEQLAAAKPEEERPRVRLVQCHEQSGLIQQSLGRQADALHSFQHALGLAEQISHAHPENPGGRSNLVAIRGNLANTLRALNRRDEADQMCQDILAILEGLVRDYPDVPRYQQQLGVTLNNLGLFCNKGPEASLAFYQRALAVRAKLVERDPKHGLWRRDLGVGYRNLSGPQSALGRKQDALASLEEARRHLRECVANEPSVTLYQFDLAFTDQVFGDWHQDARLSAQAVDDFNAAADRYAGLLRTNPDDVSARQNLVVVHDKLGDACGTLEKWDAAVRAFHEACRLLEASVHDRPADTETASDLANLLEKLAGAQRQLGQTDEAQGSLRQARDLLTKLAHEHPDKIEYAQRLNALGAGTSR